MDLCYTDPAQHINSAGSDVDDLECDPSVRGVERCPKKGRLQHWPHDGWCNSMMVDVILSVFIVAYQWAAEAGDRGWRRCSKCSARRGTTRAQHDIWLFAPSSDTVLSLSQAGETCFQGFRRFKSFTSWSNENLPGLTYE